MIEIFLDTLIDGLKILPFLWGAFFIIELLEHKFSGKSKKVIEKSGRFGPILGGILGCFPQCGFSVMATNLYVTRVITLGTLISVYLSTSDEMLPILLSHGSDIKSILEIIFSKMLIGIVSGLVIDFFFRKEKSEDHIHELCEEEHCDCEHGLFLSSFKHTIHTFFFIMIVSLFLNIIMFYGGEEYLKGIFHKNSLFSPVLASLIGLIPNCGASVVLTELYLNGVLSFSSVVAGLLTGSGVAFVVLFRTNKNVRENIKILCMVYLIGVISGFVLELFMFLV